MPPTAIGEYGLIGDCRTAALVSRDGAIDWLCLPDFSSPAVCARLLDPDKGGCFFIRPTTSFEVSRRYLEGTAVLQSDFRTDTGTLRLTDFFPIHDGLRPMRPMRELVRLVEVLDGVVELECGLDLRPDFGRRRPRVRRRGALGWIYDWGSEALFVRGDLEPGARVRLAAGERRSVALGYVRNDPAILPPIADEARDSLAQTVDWWRRWSGRCRYRGAHEAEVRRSLITLKLLNYALSGAVVAAPTTSLPEQPGGTRNWDYRYCWLRDAGLINQALVSLGYLDEARAYLDWLLHATRLTRPELRVLYDVFGRTPRRERVLAHLAGFAGNRPVRIGNAAAAQRQLDVYGDVVNAAFAVAEAGGCLDRGDQRMLRDFGLVVCRQWNEPDSGIWEIRCEQRHYTFSKVMCWVALDRLLKLQASGALRMPLRMREAFAGTRAEIEAAIEARGFNEKLGAYVGVLDGDRVDAALLLIACLGYREAQDRRVQQTLALLQARLACDGLMYRYERGYDGHPEPEGAFGICSFWAIDALAKAGRVDEAARSFEHLLGFANDLGLYGEEIDPASGAALGNFPQAFTHVGLINAALAIEAARR
jgi:GH15 family glucan-1,4-alpha-glucosidase